MIGTIVGVISLIIILAITLELIHKFGDSIWNIEKK